MSVEGIQESQDANHEKHPLELSAEGLRALQEKDPTLANIRRAADGHPTCAAGIGFFKRDGLLYRKWTPPGRGEESEVEQLVLPQECRKIVLELGHEIPLAGFGKILLPYAVQGRREVLHDLCYLPVSLYWEGSSRTSHPATSHQ